MTIQEDPSKEGDSSSSKDEVSEEDLSTSKEQVPSSKVITVSLKEKDSSQGLLSSFFGVLIDLIIENLDSSNPFDNQTES